jgi:DNA-binding NarL/FixJ family response regulator
LKLIDAHLRGGEVEASKTRILIVDDFELFRRFLCSKLSLEPELQVVSEAADGLEAVRKAEELQPDLILLDVGLPRMSGIEAARQIRKLCPDSKILFVSQQTSSDVVQAALDTGACGYLVKADAGSQLIPAVRAVLRGETYVGASVRRGTSQPQPGTQNSKKDNGHNLASSTSVVESPPQERERCHEVGFYSDERSLVAAITAYVSAALKTGGAAIVVATAAHRDAIVGELQGKQIDVSAAVTEGKYVTVDTADALASFMHAGMLDSASYLKLFSDLIRTVSAGLRRQDRRTAIYGECVNLLWAQGKVEAAIQIEKLTNQLCEMFDIDMLCGYTLCGPTAVTDDLIFERICAEHSAVHSHL